ncbi:hypothetical protein [Gelidibacter gilvus]|uniref:Uncharacterized protein n=1 Tax=Gelidibacter gilvus TaxID=59602 RepID=A0A4Q0XHE9_9FLAO|nr:hypothetical protein [Gelidibacter gilvus]RXJ49409.1 hypothetical protein ESZ48_12385 [Gelidibacter gilvus]
MITETVFEILGEGGGINIKRQKTKAGEKFLYNHSEYDFTEEGLDVNKNSEYENFEKPFQLIHDKHDWYMLHVETVHDDYRAFIVKKLIEKLNKESRTPDCIDNSKNKLEESFKIKLEFRKNNAKSTWSYTEAID